MDELVQMVDEAGQAFALGMEGAAGNLLARLMQRVTQNLQSRGMQGVTQQDIELFQAILAAQERVDYSYLADLLLYRLRQSALIKP